MIKRLIYTLLLSCSIMFPGSAFAEYAVIVSASNGNASMSSDDISRIFLGKTSKFPNGSKAKPLDQSEDNPARESFNNAVLGKDSSQLKAYWSRLIFTGKGTPPKEAGDDTAVKSQVAGDTSAIGYVDASVVDDSVTVVYSY